MKLRKQDQEFRNPRIFYPDPKNADLDRVLINLFLLLKCEGTRPVTRGRVKQEFEKVDVHLESLAKMPGFRGVSEHKWIAKRWLETDVFDLVNRGLPTEAIASLRPLHLDAYKIRVSKHCRDYNHADALYAMLEYGEMQALRDLKSYLEKGRDPTTGKFDGKTLLDLETLAVLKLVEGIDQSYPSGEKVTGHPPICVGQARVLCDDVQGLLAYQDVIPRTVMIDYLKTILGLHLGLFTLRVGRQLAGWVRDKQAHPACMSCPVHGRSENPFAKCPYQVSLTVDMGADFRTRMARIAQESAKAAYDRLLDLIKAIFAMNQLLRYAHDNRLPDDPANALRLLAERRQEFDVHFQAVLLGIKQLNQENEEELTADDQAILAAGLTPFDTVVELVTQIRQKHHWSYIVQMVDKVFQKNSPFGALVQGRSLANPRRWQLGGRLLEVFVQLAVLKAKGDQQDRGFSTQPILIDDFVRWIERRYGFVVGPSELPGGMRPVTPEEHRAFRENVRALKDRLREIGFYDDLSDAYNAQTVRPRYALGGQGGVL